MEVAGCSRMMRLAQAASLAIPRGDNGRGSYDRPREITVRSDMTDIGSRTYTILTQIAAKILGEPIEQVRMDLGLAPTCPSVPVGRLLQGH